MMALQHTMLGTSLGLATAPVLNEAPTSHKVGWVALWAGMSLWNDLDHEQSSASRMWGPLSGGYRARIWGRRRRVFFGISDVIGWVSGGHRRCTHSVLAIAVMLAGVWMASWSRIGTGLVVAFGTGLVFTAVLIVWGEAPRKVWLTNLVVSAAAGWAAWDQSWSLPGWVPWAMAGGVAAHILGDMLTKDGVPLEWPWSSSPTKTSLMPVEAGGPFERWIYRWTLVVVISLQLAYMAGFHPIGAVWSALSA